MDKRGFTLIELLVVIAIIAILSAVVITYLNGAKGRANDAAVKSYMSQVRSMADVYYVGNGYSFDNDLGGINGVCFGTTLPPVTATSISATPTLATDGITPSVNGHLSLARASGPGAGTTLNLSNLTAGSPTRTTCHYNSGAWVAEAPLSGSVAGSIRVWCVDSTGVSRENTTNILSNSFVCP